MSDAPSETSRWMIARSRICRTRTCEACRCVSAYIHTQITTFLNADRDVDLSGAKTADAVPSRHRLLPFDNREGPSPPLSFSFLLSSCLNSEDGGARRRGGKKGGSTWRRKRMKSVKELGNYLLDAMMQGCIVARYVKPRDIYDRKVR